MEPGSSDCQPRLELCEPPPDDASPPLICIGVSSLVLVELEAWLVLEALLEPLLPLCGRFRLSPPVDELSWLALCSAEWSVQL